MFRTFKNQLIGLALIGTLIPAFLFMSDHLRAQSAAGEVRMQFLPATNTDVVTVQSGLGYLVSRITLSNTSASTVTCNVRDRSTNCGGAACQFWPDISITAHTLQAMDFGGASAIGGLAWSCSTGNVVVGNILGRP